MKRDLTRERALTDEIFQLVQTLKMARLSESQSKQIEARLVQCLEQLDEIIDVRHLSRGMSAGSSG